MKITIQNLSKAFGGRDIFSDFSLDIDSGVRLCVCGPNGCGKSTLIRMLADADAPRRPLLGEAAIVAQDDDHPLPLRQAGDGVPKGDLLHQALLHPAVP